MSADGHRPDRPEGEAPDLDEGTDRSAPGTAGDDEGTDRSAPGTAGDDEGTGESAPGTVDDEGTGESAPGTADDEGTDGSATSTASDEEDTDDTDWSGAGTDDAVAAALGPAGARDLPQGDVHAHATVRVLRGEPDDVELAALVAGIVAARGAPAEPEEPAGRSAPWSDHARPLRLPPVPGTDAWRWSLQR